jgi:hypothetical protein
VIGERLRWNKKRKRKKNVRFQHRVLAQQSERREGINEGIKRKPKIKKWKK